MAPSKKPSKKAPAAPAQTWASEASELFSVGHQPQVTLSAEQERLFKSFQSNLVSLLSHELRTPLMGILNALSALDESGEPLGGLSRAEALAMAREQSQKLDAALSTVLDLAAWEAGNLQVELREGDFTSLASGVFGAALVGSSQNRLLDSARLKRALLRLKDLIQALGKLEKASWSFTGGALTLEVLLMDEASVSFWDRLWHEARVARAAHASLPLHVFAGVLQNEEGFLSRTREGLGAELHLVAQILAQHEAQFEATRSGTRLTMQIELPPIEGKARILKLLQGRIWRPGVSEPAHLELRLVKSGGPNRYPLEEGRYLEIGAAQTTRNSGSLRCPEDGVDAAALLDRVLASQD